MRLRRGAAKRIEHQQQLHEVVVHRRAGRLDDEHVAAAHVLGDLDHHLAVAEAAHVGLPERHLQDLAHLGGQRPVRVAGEYLDLVSHRSVPRPWRRSWAGRIRTFDTGSKVRGLTNLATAHRLSFRHRARSSTAGTRFQDPYHAGPHACYSQLFRRRARVVPRSPDTKYRRSTPGHHHALCPQRAEPSLQGLQCRLNMKGRRFEIVVEHRRAAAPDREQAADSTGGVRHCQ